MEAHSSWDADTGRDHPLKGKEASMDNLVATYRIGTEKIQIWERGNLYWVYFEEADCSVAGTLLEVWREIANNFPLEDLQEI